METSRGKIIIIKTSNAIRIVFARYVLSYLRLMACMKSFASFKTHGYRDVVGRLSRRYTRLFARTTVIK